MRIVYILILLLFIGCSSTSNKSEKYNQTIKTILERRSVRSFTDQAISSDTLDLIIRAAMAAPTALDKRPWEFIVLDNKKDVYSLYESTKNDRFETAPAAIIICGDNEISNFWLIDCSCAAENLLLAVQSMGLGAVYTAVYPIEDRINPIKTHFNLPDNIIPLCAIPIGHSDLDTSAKNKYNKNKIHINTWK